MSGDESQLYANLDQGDVRAEVRRVLGRALLKDLLDYVTEHPIKLVGGASAASRRTRCTQKYLQRMTKERICNKPYLRSISFRTFSMNRTEQLLQVTILDIIDAIEV